jgi:hypothetical protein
MMQRRGSSRSRCSRRGSRRSMRLGLEAEALLDRIDGSRSSWRMPVSRGWLRCSGAGRWKNDLATGQALQQGLQPALEDDHAGEVVETGAFPTGSVAGRCCGGASGRAGWRRSDPSRSCRMRVASCSSTPRWRSMYSRIERLMCGKMCGLALCSVLSRSNSQTGKFDLRETGFAIEKARVFVAGFLNVALDHRADAVVGQDFQQQRVFDAAVDDMCTPLTPLRAASSAEPILGSMPPDRCRLRPCRRSASG